MRLLVLICKSLMPLAAFLGSGFSHLTAAFQYQPA
jgi:hypothetical protein